MGWINYLTLNGYKQEEKMRKLLAIVATALIIGSTAYAVDMGGKIGFGVGPVPGSSILEPSFFSMRVGIINPLVVEPWFLYYSDVSDDKYDTLKTTNTDIGVGVRALFAFLSKDKSNLYATFGFGVEIPKTVVEDYSVGTPAELTTSEMGYSVYLGLSLEHFVTPNFSVAISSEGGFSGFSSTTENTAGTTVAEDAYTTIFIGNGYGFMSNFGLMFNWYL